FFGKVLADGLESALNPAGAAVVLLATFFISLFLTTTFSFSWAVEKLKPRFAFVGAWAEKWNDWKTRPVEVEEEPKKIPKQVISTPRETLKPAVERRATDQEREVRVIERPIVKPKPIAKAPAAPAPAPSSAPANFPPTSLLKLPIAVGKIDEEELRQRAALLEAKTR